VRKLLLSESTARSTFLVESSGSARKLLLLMTVRVVVVVVVMHSVEGAVISVVTYSRVSE
jgi:hypothetical protein